MEAGQEAGKRAESVILTVCPCVRVCVRASVRASQPLCLCTCDALRAAHEDTQAQVIMGPH